MTLWSRIKNSISAFRETAITVDQDDNAWERLTGDSSRDLSFYPVERAQQICYFLYDRNPMAKRMINMTAEYLIGEGVKVKAESEELQQFFDDFWTINDLSNRLEDYCRELGLWGEQCYQAFINKVNGRVRLGYHDPGIIRIVKSDPQNILQLEKIILRGNPERVLAPVTRLEMGQDLDSPYPSFYVGDTFFFKVNSVIKSSRGRSDLWAASDFFDLVNQFVFSRGERSLFSNAFMWDCEVQDATPDELKKRASEQGPPQPGSVRYHNQKVKWQAIAPDLKAHDAHYDSMLLQNFVLGSQGYPEHYFGSGGDVNRATAAEMHEPVVKMLTSRQRFIVGSWTKIHDFVIDKGIAFKSLRPDINRKYQFYFPDLSVADMQKSGLTMLYLAQSLVMAVKAGWITGEAAAQVYAHVTSSFGPTVEAEKTVVPVPDAPDASGRTPNPDKVKVPGREPIKDQKIGVVK